MVCRSLQSGSWQHTVISHTVIACTVGFKTHPSLPRCVNNVFREALQLLLHEAKQMLCVHRLTKEAIVHRCTQEALRQFKQKHGKSACVQSGWLLNGGCACPLSAHCRSPWLLWVLNKNKARLNFNRTCLRRCLKHRWVWPKSPLALSLKVTLQPWSSPSSEMSNMNQHANSLYVLNNQERKTLPR